MDEEYELLISSVYDEETKLTDITVKGQFIYDYVHEGLMYSFVAGFGDIGVDQIQEFEKARYYRTNIGRFSGAKTFHQFKELTDNVFAESGQKRSFAKFRDIANNLNVKYNKTHLEVERDMVFQQSQNARSWINIDKEKDLFPYLLYQTVGDDRVRPSHKKLDGIVRRVDDPIWKRIMPANGWRCRCEVIQLTELEAKNLITSDDYLKKKIEDIEKDFEKDPFFRTNVGMDDYIFKEKGKGKHPYFVVPRKWRKEIKTRFGFKE